MKIRTLAAFTTIAAATAAAWADNVAWEALPYTPISTYEAVTATGGAAYTGGFPVKFIGVVINNTEDWLDPTPAYDPGVHPWQMGGQAEVIIQAVNPGDFGGIFCWMGQNYGNNVSAHGGGDPVFSYTDAQWTAELGRLGLYGGDGVTNPLRAGMLVEIRACAGLNYGGKYNVNEQHNPDSSKDFEIVVLDPNFGMPTPTALPLNLIKDATPGANFNTAIFDATRATGGERYQATLVDLKNVKVISGTWGVNQTVTVEDRQGLTLNFYLGLNAGFGSTIAPPSYFNAEGIVQQASSTGRDGYSVLALDPSGIIRHGDVDKDHRVSIEDFGKVVSAFTGFGGTGKTWANGNFNEAENGSVDLDDFAVTITNFTGYTAYGPSGEGSAMGEIGMEPMASPAVGAVQLEVDPGTGLMKLVGNGAQVMFWDIYSPSGSLVADADGNASPWLDDYLINNAKEVGAYKSMNHYVAVDGEMLLDAAFKVGGTMDLEFRYGDTSGSTVRGAVVAVPEPAGLALLALGGLALLRRRR